MYLRRYILLLHRPFMIMARKDPRYYLSRKICLETAMIIASYADTLSLPSNELDDLSRLTMTGTGSFKGALSLDIISVLGLEVITQLEEEASTRSPEFPQLAADPLDEMANNNREPIMKSLEHILEQLLQIIALGNPSLKRYGFVAAMLSEIRAMKSNENVQQTVYESVKDSLLKCQLLLQNFTGGPPGPMSPMNSDTPFDFESLVCLFSLRHLTSTKMRSAKLHPIMYDLDIPSLFFYPDLVDDSVFSL